MTSSNQPLKPTTTPIWKVPAELWRKFVWSDLRDGLLRVSDLSVSMRAVVVIGLILLFTMLGVIVLNRELRFEAALIPLIYTQDVAGRGALAPRYLIPITMFVISVGWSLILAGTIHVDWRIKTAVLYLFFVFTLQMFLSFIGVLAVSGTNLAWAFQLLMAAFSFLGVFAFVAVRSFFPQRPGFEFLFLFCLIGILFSMIQFSIVSASTEFGSGLGFTTLELAMIGFSIITLFFLMQIGIDIARFVRKAAIWSTEILDSQAGPGGLRIVSIGLLVWLALRSIGDVWGFFEQWGFSDGVLSLLSGGVIIALTWASMTLIGSTSDEMTEDRLDEMVDRYSVYVTFGILGLALINVIVSMPVLVLGIVGFERLSDSTIQLFDFLEVYNDTYLILVGLIIAGAGYRLAQTRGWIGRYLILVGGLIAWHAVTKPDGLLPWFNDHGMVPITSAWTLCLLGFGGRWLGQGKLTRPRMVNLVFLTLVLLLLRQTEFIEDPFSPFLSFTGVGLLVFGILWDVLTIGSWANESSPGLPRMSRVYLYLGYALISTAVINWSFSRHLLNTVELFTGGGALVGFQVLGLPMLYLLFPILLSRSDQDETVLLAADSDDTEQETHSLTGFGA